LYVAAICVYGVIVAVLKTVTCCIVIVGVYEDVVVVVYLDWFAFFVFI